MYGHHNDDCSAPGLQQTLCSGVIRCNEVHTYVRIADLLSGHCTCTRVLLQHVAASFKSWSSIQINYSSCASSIMICSSTGDYSVMCRDVESCSSRHLLFVQPWCSVVTTPDWVEFCRSADKNSNHLWEGWRNIHHPYEAWPRFDFIKQTSDGVHEIVLEPLECLCTSNVEVRTFTPCFDHINTTIEFGIIMHQWLCSRHRLLCSFSLTVNASDVFRAHAWCWLAVHRQAVQMLWIY